MQKFDLFKILRKEGRAKGRPLQWISKVKEGVDKLHVTEEELLKMFTNIELTGVIPRGSVVAPLATSLLGKINLNVTFPVTKRLKFPHNILLSSDNSVGVCPSSEKRHRDVLGVEGKPIELGGDTNLKKGFVLTCEGIPIGYIKMYGSRSFLSFENLGDREGNLILIKGMLYALSDEVVHFLESISLRGRNPNDWIGITVENLSSLGYPVSFTPMRMLEDPEIVRKLSEVWTEIGSDGVKVMDIDKKLHDAILSGVNNFAVEHV